MAVNRHVLIPRPETELLAEAGWQFLSTINHQPSTALDFGTGSGCIAIALAAKCPSARVIALDFSAEALALAQQNAAKNGVAERVEFCHGDGFDALKPGECFDLIISNPPYIPSAEIETLQPEVRDHDPRGALDGGADGLDFYRRLATEAGAFLKPPNGKIMIEFGEGQAEAISTIFLAQNWTVESVQPDYSKRLRFLIARPGSAGVPPASS